MKTLFVILAFFFSLTASATSAPLSARPTATPTFQLSSLLQQVTSIRQEPTKGCYPNYTRCWRSVDCCSKRCGGNGISVCIDKNW